MAGKNQCDNNNQPTNESEICGLYVPTILSLILTDFFFFRKFHKALSLCD